MTLVCWWLVVDVNFGLLFGIAQVLIGYLYVFA